MGFKSIALVASTLILSTSANASIVTMDFGEPSLVGQYFLDGELVTNTPVQIGTLGSNGAADIIAPPVSYTSGPINGSAYLHSSIYSSIFIQANQSDIFSLISFDLGEYSSYSSNDSVTITGYKNSGTQITETFQLDSLFDGLGGINDFQSITLDANWNNLTRVEFDSSAYSLDNIQLDINQVPVPTAVWLFGSGLLGLIGVARRKARA